MRLDQPIAWISEEMGGDDGFSWTGLVSAEIQFPDSDRIEVGPQAVELEEAIAWSRARANAVLFRFDNQLYSAGTVAPADAIPWTADELRPRPRRLYEEREPWAGAWTVQIAFSNRYEFSAVEAALVDAGFADVHRVEGVRAGPTGGELGEADLVVSCDLRSHGDEAVSDTVSRVLDDVPRRELTLEDLSPEQRASGTFVTTEFSIQVVGPADS